MPTALTKSCLARWFAPLWLVLGCMVVAVPPSWAQDGAALRARHASMAQALSGNAFGRPLVLESSETAGRLQGDIYARIDQPFDIVGPALQGGANWCEVLILHLNVKLCRADATAAGPTLRLAVGSKSDQPLADTYPLVFAMHTVASRSDYLQVSLSADQGPLGTSDYRLKLEVVPIGDGRSFIHLSYAYRYGIGAAIAMRGYLATIGRDKVGFSVVGREADGTPIYIGSTRGVVERNTMRYYIAIEAYLGALALPPAQRFERRLAAWFAGVERYPVQLHELELDEYLSLKRGQAQRAPADG